LKKYYNSTKFKEQYLKGLSNFIEGKMFKNLSIKKKILSIVVFSIFSFAIYLAYISMNISQNEKTLNQMGSTSYPLLELASSNIFKFSQMNSILQTSVISSDEESVRNAKDLQDELIENAEEILLLEPNMTDYFSKEELLSYFNLANRLTTTMISEGFNESLTKDLQLKNEQKEKLTQAFIKFKVDRVDIFNNQIESTISKSKNSAIIGYVIGGVTIFVLLFLSIAIIKNISRSINTVINSIKELSDGDGDLTQRINYKNKDEMGELVLHFNKLMDKLQNGFSQINDNFKQLIESNQKISNVIQQSNNLSVEQNNFTSEVDTTVNETTNQINDVNNITTETINLFKDTLSETESAIKIVNDNKESITKLSNELESSNELVNQLEAGSQNINEILNVIKGIAEQTNLLALNAAIEAARAGDAGRGFAVVADEVRKLASQTQDSTNNIQEVIEKLQTISKSVVSTVQNSRDMAIESVNYSDSANISMLNISNNVKEVYQFNEKIAFVNKQQLDNSGIIKHSMEEIKKLSDNSVSLARDLENSSSSLNSVSDNLGSVISQFKF
tara:strand:+ start:2933 stop:4612 length:1680 start_codon:yes stop_codon:yes gene_type:complete